MSIHTTASSSGSDSEGFGSEATGDSSEEELRRDRTPRAIAIAQASTCVAKRPRDSLDDKVTAERPAVRTCVDAGSQHEPILDTNIAEHYPPFVQPSVQQRRLYRLLAKPRTVDIYDSDDSDDPFICTLDIRDILLDRLQGAILHRRARGIANRLAEILIHDTDPASMTDLSMPRPGRDD